MFSCNCYQPKNPSLFYSHQRVVHETRLPRPVKPVVLLLVLLLFLLFVVAVIHWERASSSRSSPVGRPRNEAALTGQFQREGCKRLVGVCAEPEEMASGVRLIEAIWAKIIGAVCGVYHMLVTFEKE